MVDVEMVRRVVCEAAMTEFEPLDAFDIDMAESIADRAAKELAGRSVMGGDAKACPCLHTTPCHDRCTCVQPLSSSGCRRCCTYGSPDQQRAAAEQLAGRAVALSEEERETAEWLRKLVDRPVFYDLRSDPVVAEHVKMCRSSVALLDRMLAGAPAVDPAQREDDLREAFIAGGAFTANATTAGDSGCGPCVFTPSPGDVDDAATEYARSKAGTR